MYKCGTEVQHSCIKLNIGCDCDDYCVIGSYFRVVCDLLTALNQTVKSAFTKILLKLGGGARHTAGRTLPVIGAFV